VRIWGSGTPRREFLHVEDCADACVFLMKHYSDALPVNVGSGSDIAIIDLARLVMEELGYPGDIVTDPAMPDGTMRKLLDCSRLNAMGWSAKIDLREGIRRTYAAFLAGSGRGIA
jgi:GDP-L-fucose synthase